MVRKDNFEKPMLSTIVFLNFLKRSNFIELMLLFCSVDATESPRHGRFVNDSVMSNCRMKVFTLNDAPVLCLEAIKIIHAGEELR